ncbi:MAG: CoA pyrophosphatase [Ktedonobacteraceae bacterium]|nr:CoA pyrophosphatase [Ktedonobacteraceae bacterium]
MKNGFLKVVRNAFFLTGVCYNMLMNIPSDTYATHTVLAKLRRGLKPLEESAQMIDTVEGQRPQARKAAVLLPFFERGGDLCLAFIRRASTLRAHSGEIAFPGGSVDPGDSSLAMTALREAQEEIGLEPQRVEPLGVLEPVFTVVSNYLITPVVAYLPQGLGEMHLQQSEVAELLIIPLRELADPTIAHVEIWQRNGTARTVYFYDCGPYRIWGATGRMLHALLGLLHSGEWEPRASLAPADD